MILFDLKYVCTDVNFINVKRANFLYETLLQQLFSSYMYVKKRHSYVNVDEIDTWNTTFKLLHDTQYFLLRFTFLIQTKTILIFLKFCGIHKFKSTFTW